MRLVSVIIISWLLSASTSCTRFLDVKPDESLSTPTSIRELQALLDHERYIVQLYPTSGDIASDYFYLNNSDWASLGMDFDRNTYVWHEQGMLDTEWRTMFERILVFNVVLAEVDQAKLNEMSETDRSRIKGTAHFFRAWSYLQLAQLFAPHYQPGLNDDDWGLPLRTDPDINIPTRRNTLMETYNLIFDDLKKAVQYLPARLVTPTRPSQGTAYAALARANLIIGRWEQAYLYADSCLQMNRELMNYNEIDYDSNNPFPLFNTEVLLHTTILSSSAPFMPGKAKVDSTLFKSYEEHDIRKYAYYYQNQDGTYSFKGNYTGEGNSVRGTLLFAGIATDEVYIIKAEALARLGRSTEAIDTLNALMINRYQPGWQPYDITTVGEGNVLRLVLDERRKSLAFRAGIRWSDLRRLNIDERFSQTLVRSLDGETYTLPPNDARYTFLIPVHIIQLTGMTQNSR